MKKVFVLLLVSFLLFGCGKEVKEETIEIKICNELEGYIEKYNNKTMTFDEIIPKLQGLQDNYCNNNNGDLCMGIRVTLTYSNGKFKNEKLEDAYIFDLNRNCAKARE